MKSQKKVFESRVARAVSMNELFRVLDDNRQEEAWAFVLSLLEAQENEKETGEDQNAEVMTVTEANALVERIMSLDDSVREWFVQWFVQCLLDADIMKREGKKSVSD